MPSLKCNHYFIARFDIHMNEQESLTLYSLQLLITQSSVNPKCWNVVCGIITINFKKPFALQSGYSLKNYRVIRYV
jgi:hypothetical protein